MDRHNDVYGDGGEKRNQEVREPAFDPENSLAN